MSTSCITSATATTTNVTTVESLLTTFTESLSTQLPIVTTITSEGCALGLFSNLSCISTATTITSTIPASTATIDVPVTSTIELTSTQTFTLFGSSCTVIPSSSSAAVLSPTLNVTTSGSVALSLSLSTPSASVFTSQSAVVLSDGQTSSIAETFTSTFAPSYVTVTLAASGGLEVQSQDNNATSANVGAIVGGALGGFFGLLGIALIVWFIMKRRRRWDDIFDPDIARIDPPRPTRRFSLDAEVEPKPYQYGLVGQTRSPSISLSPPSTPQPFSYSAPSPERHNSLAPLLLPNSISTPGPSATSASSRPSTAGSMRPLVLDSPPGPRHNHTTSGESHHVPAMPSNWGHHSPSPSAGQEYFDQAYASYTGPPPRAGSPTSVQEYEPQLRLRLANRGDGESELEESLPMGPPLSKAAAAARHVHLESGSISSGLGAGVLVHTDAGPAPPEFHG